jgi:hypothetical protein
VFVDKGHIGCADYVEIIQFVDLEIIREHIKTFDNPRKLSIKTTSCPKKQRINWLLFVRLTSDCLLNVRKIINE